MSKVEENIAMVWKLVETFPEERRKKVTDMLNGPVGEAYFTAPGSSREQYHDCYPGGLMQHSLNVVMNLWRLVKDLCPDEWPKHKLSFCGLFHDFGKVGDGENERYLPNPSDWHRNRGNLYIINPDMKWMTTAEGGLFILQEHGIKLDYEEWASIRLNDGQYVRENEPYAMKEPKLALLVHWADLYDAKCQKKL